MCTPLYTVSQAYDLALSTKPDHVEALHNRGVAYKSLGRNEIALESFRRALAVQPSFVPSLRGETDCLTALARYDEAAESASKAMKFRPNDPGPVSDRAFALLKGGKLEESVKMYSRARELGDDSAETKRLNGIALSQLAVQLDRAGDLQRAEQCYDSAIEIEATESRLFNRAYLHMRGGKGKQGAAVEGFQRVIAMNGNHPQAFAALGSLCLQAGDYERGLEALLSAHILQPNSAEVSYNLGFAHLKLNDTVEAEKCFGAALKMDPSLKVAAQGLQAAKKAKQALPKAVLLQQQQNEKRQTISVDPSSEEGPGSAQGSVVTPSLPCPSATAAPSRRLSPAPPPSSSSPSATGGRNGRGSHSNSIGAISIQTDSQGAYNDDGGDGVAAGTRASRGDGIDVRSSAPAAASPAAAVSTSTPHATPTKSGGALVSPSASGATGANTGTSATGAAAALHSPSRKDDARGMRSLQEKLAALASPTAAVGAAGTAPGGNGGFQHAHSDAVGASGGDGDGLALQPIMSRGQMSSSAASAASKTPAPKRDRPAAAADGRLPSRAPTSTAASAVHGSSPPPSASSSLQYSGGVGGGGGHDTMGSSSSGSGGDMMRSMWAFVDGKMVRKEDAAKGSSVISSSSSTTAGKRKSITGGADGATAASAAPGATTAAVAVPAVARRPRDLRPPEIAPSSAKVVDVDDGVVTSTTAADVNGPRGTTATTNATTTAVERRARAPQRGSLPAQQNQLNRSSAGPPPSVSRPSAPPPRPPRSPRDSDDHHGHDADAGSDGAAGGGDANDGRNKRQDCSSAGGAAASAADAERSCDDDGELECDENGYRPPRGVTTSISARFRDGMMETDEGGCWGDGPAMNAACGVPCRLPRALSLLQL